MASIYVFAVASAVRHAVTSGWHATALSGSITPDILDNASLVRGMVGEGLHFRNVLVSKPLRNFQLDLIDAKRLLELARQLLVYLFAEGGNHRRVAPCGCEFCVTVCRQRQSQLRSSSGHIVILFEGVWFANYPSSLPHVCGVPWLFPRFWYWGLLAFTSRKRYVSQGL